MKISPEELELLAKVMLPLGYTRFRRYKGQDRLKDGIELDNMNGYWALSLYRNVHNLENDVEIAIGAARLVTNQGVAAHKIEEWLEWLRSRFHHRDHKTHGTRYNDGEPVKVGLKLDEAHQFLALLMQEVLKAPSSKPWEIGPSPNAAPAKALEVPNPDQLARQAAIEHMVRMALQARDQSGLERVSTAKDKEVRFASEEALRSHVDEIWRAETCAISGVKLDLSRIDLDLAPSLDRIHSDGHYEVGNLQVVARFINRWKSDDAPGNFQRLLAIVRAG